MNPRTLARKDEPSGWMLGMALVIVGLSFIIQSMYEASVALTALVAVGLILAATRIGPKRSHTGRARFRPPLVLVPALLFSAWYFITVKFGDFGVGPILFHMDYGVQANGVVGEFLATSYLPLGSIAALVVGLWLVAATDFRFRRLDRVLVVPLLVVNPFTIALLEYVGDAQASSERPLVERYIEPAAIEAPAGDGRPNLLHIFLESSEATLREPAFGDVLGPLDSFAGRGLQLTDLREAALTNWTLAGQVAAHCGVPLMPIGLISLNSFHVIEGGFLSGAECLGDLLSRDGYETTFMKAAPLGFAGTDKFVASHGWRNRLGYPQLRPDYPLGGSEWGLDDEDAYDAAYREVVRLAGSGGPWALSLTNIGGHAPRGYVSRSCHGRPSVDAIADPTLKAFRCTHELAAELLTRLEEGGYLENTVVVVQSDHLAMRNSIYRALKRHDRRNLFFAFGPGIEPERIDRPMTMVDVYPTILELIGYAPPGGRAGIGVSALAPSETLVEERGLRALDKAIYADFELRNRLWGMQAGS
ncbi:MULTISPECIES: sulfatase-like hydrolase/transferase [unclassified Roseitalea]|uniref:sulfatase-like hydrolase/transferase n=1 Tax=unclassified Roseitalea TaxID=2639107 RepID=UPI00273D3E66|nr:MULTISPECIES: sulfatase-like hydrolase/transferase [unclassified Roseitalea]